YDVVVSVSDGRLTPTKTFHITVTADTTAPTVTIVFSDDHPRVGDEVVIKVHAVDDVGVVSRTLTLTSVTFGGVTTPLNQSLSLDAQGQARLTITEAMIGTLRFDATATDPSDNVGHAAPTNLLVPNPNDQRPPTAEILGDRHLTITEPTNILGNVDDDVPADLHWTLVLTADDNG